MSDNYEVMQKQILCVFIGEAFENHRVKPENKGINFDGHIEAMWWAVDNMLEPLYKAYQEREEHPGVFEYEVPDAVVCDVYEYYRDNGDFPPMITLQSYINNASKEFYDKWNEKEETIKKHYLVSLTVTRDSTEVVKNIVVLAETAKSAELFTQEKMRKRNFEDGGAYWCGEGNTILFDEYGSVCYEAKAVEEPLTPVEVNIFTKYGMLA